MTKKNIAIALGISVALMLLLGGLLLKTNSEMTEMEEVFKEEKETLITEYQDLYLDYDSLRRYDTDLNDKLDQERERVMQLQEELKTVKATNARKIKELQSELKTMRTVMVSFVHQIDSLNQTNIRLTDENEKMRTQVAQVRQSYNELKNENKNLSEQVEIAARLEAKNISAVGLNFNEKKATSVAKISKVKISFTIAKNVSAQVGLRSVYLRFTRPDGQLLMHSKNDTFKYEDAQINYSAMREVEYGGDDTDSYIVYKVDAGELMEGSYDIELFCGGEVIGRSSWNVKK